MLQIARVSKRFDGGPEGTVAALADIDLAVEEGEIVGLIGTSGCGKSTLLRMIGGLDGPSAGTVALDAFTRLQLQDHLLQLWRDSRPTMLFVTHDVEEALILADRVVVLRGRPGRIHRDYRIDLARPRRRADPHLAEWKERLLGDLDLAAA